MVTRELSNNRLLFLLSIAEDLETIPQKSLFKSLVLLVGDVKDASKGLLLNVKQRREQDKNLGEVKDEGLSEVVSRQLVDSKLVLFEETVVAVLLLR